MATDKSINIRQAEATEKLAASLAKIEAELAEIKAMLSGRLETKLETVSQQVRRRQS